MSNYYDPNQKQQLMTLFWKTFDYRSFLSQVIESDLHPSLGRRNQLAEFLDISPAMITKILSGNGHLSIEQIEKLAQLFGFDSHSTIAFLDRLTWARTTSQTLREDIERRSRSSFDASFANESTLKKNSEAKPLPFDLHLFKLSYAIADSPQSLTEIAGKLKMGSERAAYWLDVYSKYRDVTVVNENGEQKYYCPKSSWTWVPRTPGSPELKALAVGLRTLALSSLDKRAPINLVDESEHYVNSSFLLPLTKQQVNELQVYLSQLTTTISQKASTESDWANTKMVALCIDLFDADV